MEQQECKLLGYANIKTTTNIIKRNRGLEIEEAKRWQKINKVATNKKSQQIGDQEERIARKEIKYEQTGLQRE